MWHACVLYGASNRCLASPGMTQNTAYAKATTNHASVCAYLCVCAYVRVGAKVRLIVATVEFVVPVLSSAMPGQCTLFHVMLIVWILHIDVIVTHL